MAYPTPQEITAKAAAQGFRVGAYVHMSTRNADTAAPIREFSSINGQVQAVWMNGACRNLLGELRLSCQHRLPYQFPAGYDFLTSPQLVAEASRQAGSNMAPSTYTAARVKGYGTEAADTWITTDPRPEHEDAVYRSLRPQPEPAPFAELSPNMEFLLAGQLVTVADVAHWLDADPKQAGKLFKQMQHLYGPKPTMLNLGMFSCATEMAPMVGSVMLARKQAQGR
ncbi:hypothetical protein [Hymenobacter properus]|uniref:Uncharacterized protein n=1 Tax=Hymenobacter properus TaxID=2791026 RepID=A0A931FKY1_9BACT|nr:hypothetical protein [Hymenobacter properus]MBF9144402.1 hypothetical protein [Hymenobacter properus]MBR7723220.1 hypothetical protein [Microvirga sp. SRT04]